MCTKGTGNCDHMEYRVKVSGFSNKSWDLKPSLVSKQWAYRGKETARLTLQEVLGCEWVHAESPELQDNSLVRQEVTL